MQDPSRGIGHAVRSAMALTKRLCELSRQGTRYFPLLGIGRGGMGRVDLALALSIPGAEQLVVLKRLREPGEQSEEERASLVFEACLSARLAHRNVCATLGLDMLDGELVVVLEYLEGASLAGLARACLAAGEPFPRRILLRIVRDMLSGLEYAHDLADYDGTPLGIVHRDVSPSNVLLTTDGVAKVLDFGIAKAARSADTPPGFVKGKLGYMAPEQILGRTVDRRADVYAVGVLLWEGLTQHRFSNSDSLQICLSRRLSAEPPSVRDLVAGVPAELDAIVQRCLLVSVEQRWPTASALRAALEHYVGAYDEDASVQDVARFVTRHFGAALEGRRAMLRDRFSLSTHAVHAAAGGPSPRLVRDDAPTLGALVPRRRLGKVLPVLAGLAGVIASWTFDLLPSARADAPSSRTARERSSVAASSAPAIPRARASALPAAAPDEPRASKRPGAIAPLQQKPAPEQESGFVTIDAYPWARVTIDNVARGTTPMVHLPIAAGSHVVVLESPDRGRHAMTLEVRPGETTAERWQWE